jgi:hypothetical protein
MNTKQLLGLIGSIVLFVGVFKGIGTAVPYKSETDQFQN